MSAEGVAASSVADSAGARRRRFVMRGIAAAGVVAVVAAVAVVWISRGGGRESHVAGGGNALARELGLSKSHRCGDQTDVLRVGPDARERVFALTRTWFWVRQCLRDLLAVAEKEPASAPIHAFLERQVSYVMSQRPVRFYRFGEIERLRLKETVGENGRIDPSRFDRVVYTNKNGIAHNSMSQAEMGIWLLEAKRKLAERGILPEVAAAYEALGLAALRVVLDPVADGGLESGGPCDLRPEYPCAWYHAVTNPTRQSATEGGTLNKHLLVVNHLETASRELERIDSVDPAPSRRATATELHTAAVAGMYQLVYSSGHTAAGAPPNLLDYVARDASGAPIARSWLYYGLNPEKGRRGYFLQVNNFKNCHYHILDMRLLRDIFRGPGRDADLSGFAETQDELSGKSLLEFIVDAFETKKAEGLYQDSATAEGGNYAGCNEELFSEELFKVSGFAEVITDLRKVSSGGL